MPTQELQTSSVFFFISLNSIVDVQKFATQISHTIQQVNGEVKLNIPNLQITTPVTAAYDQQVGMAVSFY